MLINHSLHKVYPLCKYNFFISSSICIFDVKIRSIIEHDRIQGMIPFSIFYFSLFLLKLKAFFSNEILRFPIKDGKDDNSKSF